MQKRLIIAVTLSMLILLGWSAVVSKYYPVDDKDVITEIPHDGAVPTIQSAQKIESIMPELPMSEEKLTTVQSGNKDIIFDQNNGSIKNIFFNDYNYNFLLGQGLKFGNNIELNKSELSNKNNIIFSFNDEDKRIIKRITHYNSNYFIGLEIEVQNLTDRSLQLTEPLVLGILDRRGSSDNGSISKIGARFQDFAFNLQGKTNHYKLGTEIEVSNIDFVALRERYFCAIIEPKSTNWDGYSRKISKDESEIGLMPDEIIIQPGGTYRDNFDIYLGPQELSILKSVNPNWDSVIYFGKMDFVAQIIIQTLGFLHNMVKNWGITIILISLLIYIISFPLSIKQMRSMKHMQELQPAIEELKKTYKDNPQKLNKEVMELYKANKVNPLGGCLPMVLQIPIFFSLYQVLMRSVALRGASFLWIKDLSEPDRLFMFQQKLPVIGNDFNILPIIMAIIMFFQQKNSMKVSTAGNAEQQKMMVILFPIMFGFIFYNMPSGLVLYWSINSLLMLINQLRINK